MTHIGMRLFLKDMLGYLPAQIVPAIAGIAFLPVISRLLPPDEYGQYTLVLATVSVLIAISGWIDMAVVRFYPSCKDTQSLKAFCTSVFVLLGLSVALTAIALLSIASILMSSMSVGHSHAMLLGALLFALLTVSNVLQALLRVRRLVHWYTVFSIWKTVAGLGIGILLVVSLNRGVEGLLWGSIIAAAMTVPFLWAIAIRGIPFGLGDFSFKLSKDMARYSFPLMLGNLAAWILSLSDRYVIELFRGSFEVGLYSISYKVADSTILLLASLFAFAFNPLIITVWEQNGSDAARQLLERGTRYFIILCLPAVVGLSVLQKPIIALLAAPEYLDGATVLPWVAAGAFFLGLSQRFGAGLSLQKRTTPSMLCVLAAGALNLVLNFAFVPSFGFRAAAISTTVSYAFLLMLMMWFSRRLFFWIFPIKCLVRVGVACMVMGVLVCMICNSIGNKQIVILAAAIPLGVLVYTIALFIFGEIQPNEKMALKQLAAYNLPVWLIPSGWRKVP